MSNFRINLPNINQIGLLLFIFINNSFPQFDSLIFLKELRLDYEYKNIYPLGDQNSDGYDDFMLFNCNENTGYIFYGGSPIDTIPEFTIQFFDSIYTKGRIGIIDLNNDGIKDLVITTRKLLTDIGSYVAGNIRVYFGGSASSSDPDLIFNPPEGVSNNFGSIQVLNDFNGDGRNEMMIYDPFLPNTKKFFGCFYFYNTENQFDTIPNYILKGDSINKITLENFGFSHGDLNGDGKDDFTTYGFIGENPPYDRYFRNFYFGKNDFDLTPTYTFYQDEHYIDFENIEIINDINGDRRDDILIKDYGYYPFYFRNAILYGSFPIDTIPDVGLNTQNEGLNFAETYSLGDVNGDGYNDFFSQTFIFGYRNIKLWLGGKNMPSTIDNIANKTWFGTSNGFGRILSDIGDVDGDGVNDIAIGQILYGPAPDPFCKTGWVYIFKGDTSAVGDTGTVGIVEKNNLPNGFYLYEPYPNPFNSKTVISWESGDNSKTKITIYDMLGKEILIMLDDYKIRGKYEINFDASKYGLSSGVYFLVLEININNKIHKETRKLTFLK